MIGLMPQVTKDIRVLLIEDNADDAMLLLRYLSDHGYRVTADRVDSLPALRGHLDNNSYDLIISDYNLQAFTAMHALQCVRSVASATPFLVVSGSIDEETMISLVHQGASDFLTKDRLGRIGIAAEAAIHRHDLHLAKTMAESEQRETEARLRQAEKMEAIGQLAGGVAHDFNNILAVILNYAEFITEDLSSDDPTRSDVEEIAKAGEKGAALVRQLLAFSRKEITEPRVFNLNDALADLHELLKRSVNEDIEVELNMESDLPSVKADPGLIGQVVVNLVVNARDAMTRGGLIGIRTEVASVDSGQRPGLAVGRYVMLSISDSGSGMSQETQDRVFEPFFTTKPRGEGTGLGLSTVYGIVKQAGGGVYVESSVGIGTTFHVYLPESSDTLSDVVEVATGESPRGNETIMLVEDEDSVRSVVSRMLKRSGYRVVAFADPVSALDYISDRPIDDPDLLLTDVVMPNMSGKLLSDEVTMVKPNVVTVFMSGYTDELIAKKGVLDASQTLIRKPFKSRELLDCVRLCLDRGVAA